jgi:hypothetical protein
MDGYYERQAELQSYLNDNMIDDTEHIKAIAEMFDIYFIDDGETHGWQIGE